MAAPVPYIHFAAGEASNALHAYRDVFGGELELYTYADFQRTDGDPTHIQHGQLRGAVDLFGSDAGENDPPLTVDGLFLALLGAADAAQSRIWFDRLAAIGTVIDPLQERPWGDSDGLVRDRYGVTWLIGFQPEG